jgi:glycosyltransferase involved in cell wall biosynthesis
LRVSTGLHPRTGNEVPPSQATSLPPTDRRLTPAGLRIAVYCDFPYRVDGGEVTAEAPFALFLRELAADCGRLVVVGRLDPGPGRFTYVMEGVEFVPLPHYESGAQFGAVMRTLPAGLRRFWRTLAGADVAWIFGPNPPQALAFALLAVARRRRLVLGVRQNLPVLVRHRHRGRRAVHFAADVLETAFRLLARRTPVVVVGPDLARRYQSALSLHTTYVSLLHDEHILTPENDGRAYDGDELRLISVGRLDPEKNPLLLADVLDHLLRLDGRWRLDVCGDGSLREDLVHRLRQLGIADRAEIHGHVAIDDGLWEMYRRSHALVHVSLTEGVPQVLLEAFASRLPVVATAVGGVPEVVAGRGLLVPPSDPKAAAMALQRLVTDPGLRSTLVDEAAAEVRNHTQQLASARLLEFLCAAARPTVVAGEV